MDASAATHNAVQTVGTVLTALKDEVKNSGIVQRVVEVVIEIFHRVGEFFKSIFMPGSVYHNGLLSDRLYLINTHENVVQTFVTELQKETPNEAALKEQRPNVEKILVSMGLHEEPTEAMSVGSTPESNSKVKSPFSNFSSVFRKKSSDGEEKDFITETKTHLKVFNEAAAQLKHGAENLAQIKELYTMHVSLFSGEESRLACFHEMDDHLEHMVATKYFNIEYPARKGDPITDGTNLFFKEEDNRKQQRLAIQGVIIDLIENPFAGFIKA